MSTQRVATVSQKLHREIIKVNKDLRKGRLPQHQAVGIHFTPSNLKGGACGRII